MTSYLRKIAKTSICILIIASMCLSSLVFAADNKAQEPWDADYPHNDTYMKFTPEDKYVSQQNPPDFKWGYVSDATYDLVVATDPELKNIKYRKDGIEYNYYNFDYTFETGVQLYWAVRYNKGGKLSNWSTVRRFRIDPDAYEYIPYNIDKFFANIPNAHPRVWLNPDELEEFRGYKDKYELSKNVYDYYMRLAKQYASEDAIVEEPPVKNTFKDDAEKREYTTTVKSASMENIERAIVCAYAYLLSGDKSLLDYTKKATLSYKTWDLEHGVSSHEYDDQANRRVAVYSAHIYDWLYADLSESERQNILSMIRTRTLPMATYLNSLDVNPYDSHGWTIFSMVGTIAYATYGEIPESAAWLKKTVLQYSAMLPNWGYQDGGWSEGTGYVRHSRDRQNQFGRVVAKSGIDFYSKAWLQNAYLQNIYLQPYNSYGSFGDEGGDALSTGEIKDEFMHYMYYMDNEKTNPVKKWAIEKVGGPAASDPANYFLAPAYDSVESEAPTTYQLSHEFNDIGWVSMASDLVDPDRILLTFKSTPYGTFSHLHADNNAFFIEAFGQRLAVRSGFYDSYGTAHHFDVTHATFSHNTVTVADSKGQKPHDMTATGQMTGYLTQIDFDLAMADATESYKGNLGKFERAIIYIRPDMFVVVDDLKASEKKKENKFEWWLNSYSEIKTFEGANGARLQEENAVLDATVQYPQKVNVYYNDIFASSNMKEINPTARFQDEEPHKRVWFETEKLPETKMIVTMDVHRDSENAAYVDTEYFDEYVKMTFEDGTVILVNLKGDNSTIETLDGFTFDGTALVYNDESLMLVGGTKVKQGDKELITLEKRGSVVMGENELSISTYDDNRISINTDNKYVGKVEGITDYDGREVRKEIGISYESGKLVKAEAAEGEEAVYSVAADENYITFTAEKDNYQLMLNGKMITSDILTSKVKVIIDGVEEEVEVSGYKRRDGRVNYTAEYDMKGAKYTTIEKSDDFLSNAPLVGNKAAIDKLNISTFNPEGQYIKFEKVPQTKLTMKAHGNYDAVKNSMAVFKEAESFVGELPKNVRVYTTRTFLSGGAGISQFNNLGDQLNYEFEIAEEGDYSFAIKYATFEEIATVRGFSLEGRDYIFELEKTVDFGSLPENWKVSESQDTIHLKPGKYTMVLEVLTGNWNFDWLGFVKR